jgi:hypothetical protein
MLQPKNYPTLIGQAALLEEESFITMVNDDNPWAEGLMLTVSVGILVGLAQLVGSWLTSLSLPPANAVFSALSQVVAQFPAQWNLDQSMLEPALRQSWQTATVIAGYDSGGWRWLILVWTPLGLVLQWLTAGVLVHLLTRLQGGRATLNQTLGATSLMVAPSALRVLTIIPFVSVGSLLILVWSVLILYRALQITHEMPWRRAALTALAPVVMLLFAFILGNSLLAVLLSLGGQA